MSGHVATFFLRVTQAPPYTLDGGRKFAAFALDINRRRCIRAGQRRGEWPAWTQTDIAPKRKNSNVARSA